MVVPRGNWIRLVDMLDELNKNYSSPAAYVFRNNYFFLDLPPAMNETVNVTFVRYQRKVWTAFQRLSTVYSAQYKWRNANGVRLIRRVLVFAALIGESNRTLTLTTSLTLSLTLIPTLTIAPFALRQIQIALFRGDSFLI